MSMNLPPIVVDRDLAVAAVDDFLADTKWQEPMEEYNWKITRPGNLIILVSLQARPLGIGEGEIFTLRLNCEYYPTYPPDALFVNPDSGEYAAATDSCHLPILNAPYCYVHPNFTSYQPNYPYGPQLVCSSMTLGYYFSGHTPLVGQEWTPGRTDLGSTIITVYRALQSVHYKGRQT